MGATIVIEPIVIADHYGVISKMMHELHVHEHSLFDKTAPWADIETSYMRHVMNMQEQCEGLCLVAYVNGEPAGFIFGYGYVKEEHRRLGIYRMLNAALEQHFINKGIKRIIRFTLVNNTNMRQLLDSEGYGVTRLLYEKWL